MERVNRAAAPEIRPRSHHTRWKKRHGAPHGLRSNSGSLAKLTAIQPAPRHARAAPPGGPLYGLLRASGARALNDSYCIVGVIGGKSLASDQHGNKVANGADIDGW